MLQVVKRASRSRAGLPPGELVYTGEQKSERVIITLHDYDEKECLVRELASVDEVAQFALTPQTTWIDIVGLHDVAVIENIGKILNLHPMIMEDILDPEQRPKLEELDDQLFMIVKSSHIDNVDDLESLELEQLSIVLGPTYVVTFRERDRGTFEPIRKRIELAQGRIRSSGPGYLAYRLIDAVVDGYFITLEQIEVPLEALQDGAALNPAPQILQQIHHIKQTMISLRRVIWPTREVIMGLQRRDTPLIPDKLNVYLRDLYDHSTQVMETIETIRDVLTSLLDIYLSSNSNRLNQVMKVLTIISTIFIPLTFLAGVYGMNFKHFPELTWVIAYPVGFWVTCIALTAVMLAIFKKRGWY